MNDQFQEHLATELAAIESACLFKREREITTPQGASVGVNGQWTAQWTLNGQVLELRV